MFEVTLLDIKESKELNQSNITSDIVALKLTLSVNWPLLKSL